MVPNKLETYYRATSRSLYYTDLETEYPDKRWKIFYDFDSSDKAYEYL